MDKCQIPPQDSQLLSLASLTGRAAHARLALLHSPESTPRELSRAFWTTLWRRDVAGGYKS